MHREIVLSRSNEILESDHRPLWQLWVTIKDSYRMCLSASAQMVPIEGMFINQVVKNRSLFISYYLLLSEIH